MPRANRIFLPGHVWHITQRCHRREFLLKVRRDRRCWLAWLLEARRRYGLCVLNYIVTRNHIHLLVQDQGRGEIAPAMQLVAGRAAQTYNVRKGRLGAFWQDRYHATAVESDEHFLRCMTYIDLNMVRAGVVTHPSQWRECGYREIQRQPQRYRIIDMVALGRLLEHDSVETMVRRLARAAQCELDQRPAPLRERAWTESIAVGGQTFLQAFKAELGPRALSCAIDDSNGLCCLRESPARYDAGRGFRVQYSAALECAF